MKKDFYILGYEAGAMNTAVPVWSTDKDNPFNLKEQNNIIRKELPTIPGGFQLLNVLSGIECDQILKECETMGFDDDAAISLPRTVRHNQNLVWIADDKSQEILFSRCRSHLTKENDIYNGKKVLGLNQRFRFYKYAKGDFFKAHTDGSWHGSAVQDGKLIENAYPDRYSLMTFLIFLSDDFVGGETQFLVNKDDISKPATSQQNMKTVDIKTAKGSVLCFPHGTHPQHCMHSSTEITEGIKYIIRTDVLFEL